MELRWEKPLDLEDQGEAYVHCIVEVEKRCLREVLSKLLKL
jgi:hypothetical protein